MAEFEFDWRAWRRRLSWSRLQAAAALGCSPVTIEKYELGTKTARPTTVFLAAYLERYGLMFEEQRPDLAAIAANRARLKAKWAYDPDAAPATPPPNGTERHPTQ